MLLTPRFVDALAFAMAAHGDQTRKGGDIPYVSHLLGVASLVLEAGGDEDMAIAGLLHDTIEDTATTAAGNWFDSQLFLFDSNGLGVYGNDDGELFAFPLKWGGSSDFVSFALTTALVIIPAGVKSVEAGSLVKAIRLP